MPDYDPQYDYADGALSASGHTGNLFDATNPEQGLYTLYNGYLDANNIDGAAAFTQDHFQLSELAHFSRFAWNSSQVIYDETVGGMADDDPVPCGLGLRYHLPSQADVVRIDYSFFAHGSRAHLLHRTDARTLSGGFPVPQADRNDWTRDAGLELYMDVYVDGTVQEGHKIKIPLNTYLGTSDQESAYSGNSNHLTSYEHLTAQQYSGTIIIEDQAAGHHELQFRVRLENPAGSFEKVVGKKLGFISRANGMSVRLHQRLTVGNGQVIMIAKGLN